MGLVVIDRAEVRRLLTYEVCIPLMREAMTALSAGRTRQSLRQILDLSDHRAFGVMPGAMAEVFGAKLFSVFPENAAAGGQSHQGCLALFDPESGAPLAVVHAGEVTAIRTAAASAAATEALARSKAGRLAILGSGEQARAHALAIASARRLEEIRIWARSPAKAEALAASLASELELPVAAFEALPTAVAGAEIICTTTAASEPILESRWVAEGAHINLVGSSRAGPREVDDALVVRSRFYADHREGVVAQGAEFLHARERGLIGEDHLLGEIGQVFSGQIVGRRSEKEVTLYKSLGSIVQDLAAGWFLYRKAREAGAGGEAPF